MVQGDSHARGPLVTCPPDGAADMTEPTRRKWEDIALYIVAIFALAVILTNH